MDKLAVVILAAGASTRFKSNKNKLLHEIAGRPLLFYPLNVAKSLKAVKTVVVVNKKGDEVRKYLKDFSVDVAIQAQALGTAHAVASAKPALKNFKGFVVVLNGDVPLVNFKTIQKLLNSLKTKKSPIGITTAIVDDPSGYGRIVRDLDGRIVKIVEDDDANDTEKMIREMNVGLYCFKAKWLFDSLSLIKTNNVQSEYYLTDLVAIALKQGHNVPTVLTSDEGEFMGVNTRCDFAKVSKLVRLKIASEFMKEGVSIIDPESCYLDFGVNVKQDTIMYPDTYIVGNTKIGRNCIIGSGVIIKDSLVGDNVTINPYSVIEASVIKDGSRVGPFARLRPGAKLDNNVRVGNFVEIKKSHLKEGVKANHLTYLGDSVIGKNTNVGCGTITCNYDGKNKYQTTVGDNVFIGSDVQFVAPVKVGDGATIGAGSTITEHVPENSLAIARSRQVNVKGWKKRGNKSSSRT